MYMHKKDEFNNIILSLDKRTINNNPNWVSSSERGNRNINRNNRTRRK
ncbi:MAG: hypothetical protein KatS3mg002_0874 [Candidatus Woesearchaeota archaeon]|nr:MAG: hypothetical protein KatS3mg002_0874 [Candidatus Woesearchaeota archaeon]